MIRKLPFETLLQVYRDSVRYDLDPEFIDILEQELQRREAAERSGSDESSLAGANAGSNG
ncbi:sporulation histidine kinase inhibitor Sda [Paenibacillus sp.]|uniref:sporulation histidine kinase inhibitor Sda n=1 Tax=Paenibacillus sp. TaxID=58172 RepID=UPI002D4B3DDC|nr:sporulation histidine kinase inhibitor Sda [Paenibacillus sp.]HZG57681.1 sporulation histidine kinase inhibitor Sda [Paenibacillus sp.]